jgi:hypothetical protein
MSNIDETGHLYESRFNPDLIQMGELPRAVILAGQTVAMTAEASAHEHALALYLDYCKKKLKRRQGAV